MAETKSPPKGESTLYGWAFRTGKLILNRFEEIYGVDRAEKRMYTWLLNLRSEDLPARFRRQLVNLIVETKLEDVSFPTEVREERAWSIDEYYRYSTAILAGFHDAIQAWRKERGKVSGKEGKEGEGGD
ncbi:MAG: hypothetical protein QW407_02340 [Thermofilaceae archaeon]|uniref:CRISPR type III-B/RAMP module-associated protein Cmr5 n=1 Tax=Thermofilum pendens TaxID=2269 RepID=A0A7C4H2X2_THEPE